jgi:hypothetical protein
MFKPEFSESHLSKEESAFYWGDSPFVVSVQCTKTEKGFLADWWISGLRREDDQPTLMLRLKHGIEGKRNELQENLWLSWVDSIRELSYASANAGGLMSKEGEINELGERQRVQLLTFHLIGNERIGNFDKGGESKVSRTANMYLLLKSFGSKQPQKSIAEFESQEIGEIVNATAINQRLSQAKQKKLLK